MAQETTPKRTPSVVASWAGVVRVRPTGETAAPAVNRYQYGVRGWSPRTSTLTVWSVAALAVTVPEPTMREKPLSEATSQPTWVAGPRPEPGTASGVGVTRVHSRTPSGSGSPEATPWRKAGAVPAAWAAEAPSEVRGASAAVAAAARTTVRRRGVAADWEEVR